MKGRDRRCIRCSVGLGEACFPSVLARDIIAAGEGKIPYTSVREHCGKCVMWLIAYEHGGHGSAEQTQIYLNSLGDATS